jgi:hypothetical protein
MKWNPYEPTTNDPGGLPFRTRLRRALRRALREYRAGLDRQDIGRGEHFMVWLSLLLLGFVLVAAIASLTIDVVSLISRYLL